jgi:hypothetical protein
MGLILMSCSMESEKRICLHVMSKKTIETIIIRATSISRRRRYAAGGKRASAAMVQSATLPMGRRIWWLSLTDLRALTMSGEANQLGTLQELESRGRETGPAPLAATTALPRGPTACAVVLSSLLDPYQELVAM